ncbi:acyltransferase family protein [Agromyces silvae]|uniref:acyltransferase family protein n=1 Tax=Agromyces silvae TaxID=3388266 RepID=UPI00280A575C|nr:acyltransferase [Agromyces protaetiae]
MTLAADRTTGPRTPEPSRGGRDAAVDAARAACLLVVFVLHAMMVGVSVGPDGPVLENAFDGWAWFAPVSWVVQVMPLFFVIGGYAGWTAWRRSRERGDGATGFVRGRLGRLVRPAIVLILVVAAGLVALTMAGVPADVVEIAGHRIGQPLWFLAVYLGCTALVPAMVRLHERHPVTTVVALAVAVVAVDATRFATGIDAIGFANLAFVWLLMQQLGFWLADGRIERMSRRGRIRLAVSALAALLVVTLAGPYSADLFANLNPPTVCLVLLGVAQLMLFSLVRAPLRRWAGRDAPAAAIARFGEWGMTLYLWHLPAFVAVAGLLLVGHEVVGVELPEPLTAPWWLSRPLWLVAAALATALVVRGFARWERGSARRGGATRLAPTWRVVPVWLAVPAGVVGVGVLLVIGFAPVPACVALALLAVALRGARRPVAETSVARVALRA